ncbi:DUF779 domain-containing protein [Yoonia sp. GPGPB17]|uniref:DUF779 domain-containing protein n=1 Tax=Yoonia sp. GPGPB17 TaxID=3026147 RepID=UPI0030C05E13
MGTETNTIRCVTDDALPNELNFGQRVTATDAARAFLAEIKADHGEVLFHQSGGCCDGSSPMCYPKGDFRIGASDVKLGEINDTPVYISGPQFEAWKHTQLILDVVEGRGGMFSLDNGREQRFFIRSRVFSEEEIAALT